MQVIRSSVNNLTICNLSFASSIEAVFENDESGGDVYITCGRISWHKAWGNIGNRSVEEFFINCDNDYLISHLDPAVFKKAIDTNPAAMEEKIRQDVLSARRSLDIESADARDVWNFAGVLARSIVDGTVSDSETHLLVKLYGDDWHLALPTTVNPRWEFTSQVIDVVKQAIRESMPVEKTKLTKMQMDTLKEYRTLTIGKLMTEASAAFGRSRDHQHPMCIMDLS